MSIERWDPFRDTISLRDALNSLVAESFVRPGGPPSTGGAASLPLDVAETQDEFVIKASLPGIKPEDVQITVHGDTLTIRGESRAEEEKKGMHWHVRERRVSSFARSLSLGTPIHADTASAHFDNGVLTLSLPKSAEAKPKQIKVASGPKPPASIDRPVHPIQEQGPSGANRNTPAPEPAKQAGKPEPTHDVAEKPKDGAHHVGERVKDAAR